MNSTDTQLTHLSDGARGRVVHFGHMNEAYRNRLMSLGLTPGTEFRVDRRAPLGDPVEITLRGYRLSLRAAECQEMRVEPL